jgi:hypothetical protein
MPRQHENDPAMTDPSVHHMSLLVGEIKGQLQAVISSMESLNRTWGEREQAATEGRRILHEKVELMRHDVVRMEASVENVSRDVSVIKPAIEKFRTAKDQQDGAQKLGKRLWIVFIGLAGIAGGGIAEIFHAWWRGTH